MVSFIDDLFLTRHDPDLKLKELIVGEHLRPSTLDRIEVVNQDRVSHVHVEHFLAGFFEVDLRELEDKGVFSLVIDWQEVAELGAFRPSLRVVNVGVGYNPA